MECLFGEKNIQIFLHKLLVVFENIIYLQAVNPPLSHSWPLLCLSHIIIYDTALRRTPHLSRDLSIQEWFKFESDHRTSGMIFMAGNTKYILIHDKISTLVSAF